MPAHRRAAEPTPAWWRQHWLENCEEFRVEHAETLLGFVEETGPGGADDSGWLVIECRGGDSGRVRVASADVLHIDPERCLVTLHPSAHVLPVQHGAPPALVGAT